MKINEASINHNAVRLIKDLNLWTMVDPTDDDNNIRIAALGYAQGVCDLADELKKVLAE